MTQRAAPRSNLKGESIFKDSYLGPEIREHLQSLSLTCQSPQIKGGPEMQLWRAEEPVTGKPKGAGGSMLFSDREIVMGA